MAEDGSSDITDGSCTTAGAGAEGAGAAGDGNVSECCKGGAAGGVTVAGGEDDGGDTPRSLLGHMWMAWRFVTDGGDYDEGLVSGLQVQTVL
jgi:hypothetical protein